MSGSKPVQLCKNLSSKGWELDVETLWKIMEPAAGLPVAVYSIAGAFRKGKSFMLTLFLRFLRRARNGEGESWLKNVEEQLEAGFAWRTGRNRCTSGIWIWNTPFYIDTPEHGKVAVFLMDTQGAFDDKTSVQSISTIFALSTFVSSLQIFNVKEQIQQDSLQQLELFTEFAKTAKESNPEGHRRQPFQELLFLVRDWPHGDEGYGFESGAKELENLLEEENDCEDIVSVRKNLKFSFENLRCFLMNEPEEQVRKRSAKSPPLKIKDLGEDFLNDVDNLVKGLFSPDKLIIKKVNGKNINGHELRKMSKTYSEIFGKIEMPQLGTIAEANAKAAIEPVLREGQERYRETMEKAQEHGYVDPKKLQAIHKKTTEEMLIWYDGQPKLGSDGFKKEKKEYLGQQLEKRFEECEFRNESAKKSQEVEIGDLKSKIIRTFKANLKTSTEGKYLEEGDLKGVLQKWEFEAIESFENETKRFHSEFVKRLRKDFKIEMEDERNYIEERNQEMKDIAKNEISKMKRDALKHYEVNMENLMKEAPCQGEQELEGFHDRYKGEAMKKFETCKKAPQAYFEQMKLRLEEETNTQFEKIKLKNEKKQEYELNSLQRKVFSSYKKNLEKSSNGRYLEDENLNEVLQERHSETLKTFEEETKTFLSKLVRQQRKKLDAEINEEKTRFKKQNQDRKKAEGNKILTMKLNVMKHYNDNMEKFVEEKSYQGQSELEDRHNQYKKDAMEKFETCKEGPQDVFKQAKEELEEEIKKKFDKIKNQNEKNQKIELERLQRQVILTYEKNFEEATNGEYLRDESLTMVLEDCDSKATKKFEEETKMFLPELVQEQQKKLDTEMDEKKRGLKKQNQDRSHAAISKCCKKQNDAVEKYKTNIDNCIEETPCQDQSELEARHKTYKDEAMKEFETFKEVPQDDFNREKEKLEEKINELFEKAERQNKDNVGRKICEIMADARAYFLKEINAFYEEWGMIIITYSVIIPLLDIIMPIAGSIIVASRIMFGGKETKSSTEFYKEHVSNTKSNEILKKLLKMKCDEVKDQLQGPQNQAEAMRRIEAALFEIGKEIFFRAALVALLQSGLIAGAGASTGATIGSVLGPLGSGIGAVVGGVGGFVASIGVVKLPLNEAFWRWVKRF